MEEKNREKAIRPKKLAEPKAPFSYGIVTKPGKILFLAGQTPINEHGEIVGVGDFETQAKQVFENTKTVVKPLAVVFHDIVKVTIYRTDVKHRQALDRVRTAYYSSKLPTSTLVVVSGLVQKNTC